jgi:AGZA family xanthine/uracil permease-like MFS transporter
MTRAAWAPRWGDINGFFGLLVDNIAALVLFFTLVTSTGFRVDRFSTPFVLTYLIPGTVAGVLLGGLIYTVLALRLAARRGAATAMPVGLDTPSVIAVALFVLLPSLQEGRHLFRAEADVLARHHLASMYAWHVGVAVLVMIGIFKMACAPLGGLFRSFVPRAGLLGSLAAVALALIAFLPLSEHVATAPVVGVPVLAVIMVTLMTGQGLRARLPGAVLALLVGIPIVLVSIFAGELSGWSFVPLSEVSVALSSEGARPIPPQVWEADWWSQVLAGALTYLPIALPIALTTLVGGVQCAESAAAAGDDYDTRSVLFAQGAASALGGLLGGVVQNTPYFGHPAYKTMGAGTLYALAATLLFACIGYFGWFVRVFELFPTAVVYPVIVYIGLRTIAHSFESTPSRHYPALALAAVPILAYLIVVALDRALGNRAPAASSVPLVTALRCLGNGFIFTSLLWASALAAVLDGVPRRAAVFLLIAAGCSLAGLIHSPQPGGPLALPNEVWETLRYTTNQPRLQYQSPFHWAAAYVLAAGVIFAASVPAFRLFPVNAAQHDERPPTPQAEAAGELRHDLWEPRQSL